MLVKGTTAPTEFLPYQAPTTKAIPQAIQNLTGYGWGINENCYNYIDFERKVFVQKVGRAILGNLIWSFISETNRFFSSDLTSIAKSPINNDTVANLLTDKYTTVYLNYLVGYPNLDMLIALSNTGNLSIRNTAYTDTTAFKTAMSGVYLYYELETPVETDISQYLTDDDKYIDVESVGTITFTNTYEQDVPSEITYVTEVAK